jgi:ubiquinone/menaquinone biosynthesis C-methylase UbiE
MDVKKHWDKVYATKAPESVSWYRAQLETSLALIERAAVARSASIIDIGGGESTLVDDLLLRGYKTLNVLDVSPTAIEVTKKRLGTAAKQVRWLVGDIVEIELEPHAYDLWHDRAVFHFLTAPDRRLRTFGRLPAPLGRVAT